MTLKCVDKKNSDSIDMKPIWWFI